MVEFMVGLIYALSLGIAILVLIALALGFIAIICALPVLGITAFRIFYQLWSDEEDE